MRHLIKFENMDNNTFNKHFLIKTFNESYDDIYNEILEDIKRVEIDCPDCRWMDSDEQYACTTCWCEGGNGKINVYEWLKENPSSFK
jgi:hypothetical protein